MKDLCVVVRPVMNHHTDPCSKALRREAVGDGPIRCVRDSEITTERGCFEGVHYERGRERSRFEREKNLRASDDQMNRSDHSH